MSSRALRRLQGDLGISTLASTASVTASDGDGSADGQSSSGEIGDGQNTEQCPQSQKTKKKKQKKALMNPFELLNEDASNSKVETDEEKEDTEASCPAQVVDNKDKEKMPAKKKKKKNRRKGKENMENHKEQNNRITTVDDEVEASLQEVNRILGDPGVAQVDTTSTGFRSTYKPILHIDYRNLNPETEMKKMFGSQVVREQQQGRNTRQRNRPIRRSSRLIQPKDTWHSTGGSGLSMRYLGENEGFLFEHAISYQKLQHRFHLAVESGNPQHIFMILQEHPYHIDTLIQLADFYRMNEDFQTAAECIEKALFGLESAFHPMFNLATGNCFLDYKNRENRALYICLFKHILNLGRRGCYRTAFEFCKVLLSLDPANDPLEALYLIDFYALRSGQFEYLTNISREVTNPATITERVNFAFSIPLAMFHLARQGIGEMETADLILQDKLLLYPSVLIPLLDKCSVQPDKRVNNHSFLHTGEMNDEKRELRRIVTLYVERCFHCWKEVEVLAWLERNVQAVLDLVDAEADPRPNDYAKKRQARFKGASRPLLRHYVLSEISGVGLPRNIDREAILNHDPFPPTDGVQAYTDPARRSMASQSRSGILGSLLQSLLPTYDPNALAEPSAAGVRDGGQEEEEGAAGGVRAIPHNIHQGVNAIMQAMRQLLNDVQLMPPPEGVAGRPDEMDEDAAANEQEWEEEEFHDDPQ